MNSSRWEIRKSADGQFYVVYVAGNGEIVNTSEMYTSKQAATVGIDSVRANAATAKIVDKTKVKSIDVIEPEIISPSEELGDVVEEPVKEENPQSETELTSLRREYKNVLGKNPYYKWDESTLIKKIREAKAKK